MTKFRRMAPKPHASQFVKEDRTPWSLLGLVVMLDVALDASANLEVPLRQLGLYALSHLPIGQ
jgi:hypothetical protein